MTTPIANPNPDPADEAAGYVLPRNTSKLQPDSEKAERDAAAAVVRQKLAKLYADEPNAEEEIEEIAVIKPQSKHQLFMQELVNSGKNLAEIQTEWHHYYITLPEEEKHEVWQEFYASNQATSKYHKAPKPGLGASGEPAPSNNQQPVGIGNTATLENQAAPTLLAIHPAPSRAPKIKDIRSTREVRQIIRHHISAGGKLQAKHHVQSLMFGFGTGFIVLIIFLFGFFNEVIIAPFIQPNSRASATPLILSNDGVAPTSTPEVIIPKINVEIPVDYSQTSTDENQIENALESGVVHYPTTVMPGQNGNTAFFGHSSNNIFNKGKYKFAFVLLHTLVPGDTFYLTNNSKVYVYKVISKDIVDPTDVAVLGPVQGQTATATLITCDPPGTSLHRLIIVGQQISPDPSGNTTSTTVTGQTNTADSPAQLPGNGPTLWSRLWRSIF